MRFILLALVVLSVVSVPARAQENITITTYFPYPYGMYGDLNVHNKVVVHDVAGGAENANLTADSNGNLVIEGSDPFQQVIFADSGRPFSYLQAYTANGGTGYCANGYVAVGYLTSTKVPSTDIYSLPSTGYIICLRSWQ